ncbi:hypothetical protein DFH09DRAFT_1094815 [Mycena vulgaris]|nr:hypothetical protein DFH09DRAFT_1094815 [Mycena vulgaris]
MPRASTSPLTASLVGRRRSPPTPASSPRRRSPPVPTSPGPITRARAQATKGGSAVTRSQSLATKDGSRRTPRHVLTRRSPPVPRSPPASAIEWRSPSPPDLLASGPTVGLDRSKPVMLMCWKEDGVAPVQLTVYPRDDMHVRMEDHKLLLGSAAHQVEIGNVLQRFIPGRQQGKGKWVTLRWDTPIPVRGAGSRILLRYFGLSDMAHWEAHVSCLLD